MANWHYPTGFGTHSNSPPVALPSKREGGADGLLAMREHDHAHLPMGDGKAVAGDEDETSIFHSIEREELKSTVHDYLDVKLKVRDYIEKGPPSASEDASRKSPYPENPQIPHTYHTFFLGHGGLPDWKREKAISAAKKYHAVQESNSLGYQVNFNLDYQKDFSSYLDTHVNNIGDAFKEGNLTVNSKFMERAVLDYYAQLWHAKWPHDDKDLESYWGFCLSMGSTEGNLYGMCNGRDYLAGKKILVDDRPVLQPGTRSPVSMPRLVYQKCVVPDESPNAFTPIAFYSVDSHYSLAKGATMLGILTFDAEGEAKYPGQCPITDDGSWPAEVPSHDSGAINTDHLATLVEFFASRGHPILVCFNYGTSFSGAYDDVAQACDKLRPILEKYGLLERQVKYDVKGTANVDTRTGYWFHVDGALGAAYMPFMEMAYHAGRIPDKGPDFDFRLPMVNSIAMSGHKWIGSPVPSGVFMTRSKYHMMPLGMPEYIGTPDTTFAGSRNGLSPMLLWDNIAHNSYEDQIQKALRLEELAQYMEKQLRHLQDEVLKTDLYVERAPLALTVHFKRANDELCHKYSLSNEDLNGKQYSHVFMMDHVDKNLVNRLIADLSQEGAFAPPREATKAEAAILAGIQAPTTNRVALVPSQGRGFHG